MKGSEKQLKWARSILREAKNHCETQLEFFYGRTHKYDFWREHIKAYEMSLKWVLYVAETVEHADVIINQRDLFTPEAIDNRVYKAIDGKWGK